MGTSTPRSIARGLFRAAADALELRSVRHSGIVYGTVVAEGAHTSELTRWCVSLDASPLDRHQLERAIVSAMALVPRPFRGSVRVLMTCGEREQVLASWSGRLDHG